MYKKKFAVVDGDDTLCPLGTEDVEDSYAFKAVGTKNGIDYTINIYSKMR